MYDVDELTALALMNGSDTLIKIYGDGDHIQPITPGTGTNNTDSAAGERDDSDGDGDASSSPISSHYPLVPCKHGWKYDLPEYASSIVSEVSKECLYA